MSTRKYALSINKSDRCVRQWCEKGLIGKRVGGHWDIEPGTPPPVIIPKRRIGRLKRTTRLENFKRKVTA